MNDRALKSSMQYYDEEEAIRVVKRLRESMTGGGDLEKTLQEIGQEIEKENPENAKVKPLKKNDQDYSYGELLCCKRKTGKMMRLGIFINFFQVAGGVDALFAYTTKIFSELGGGVFESRAYTVVFGIATVLSTAAVFPVVDRYGRRTLIIIGNVGTFICMFMLGLLAQEFPDIGPLPSLVFVLLYVVF